MDTHVQSAMHKQEASIVGLVIMMRVVIGDSFRVSPVMRFTLKPSPRPSLQDVRNLPIA